MYEYQIEYHREYHIEYLNSQWDVLMEELSVGSRARALARGTVADLALRSCRLCMCITRTCTERGSSITLDSCASPVDRHRLSWEAFTRLNWDLQCRPTRIDSMSHFTAGVRSQR